MRILPRLLLGWFVSAACFAHAEQWPGWRGPRGDGTSAESNIARRWDGETNQGVLWKTPIPGIGHSSPIVWDDYLFVTTCLDETEERVLICLNANTGEVRWQQTVLQAPLEKKHALNSFASGTPVTDGNWVFVTFLDANAEKVGLVTPGDMVVVAFDFAGKEQWRARPGRFASTHGFCSSPVLYENLLIINGDHDGESYVVALNKSTGDVVWKTPREHQTRSYVTPIIRNVNGQDQLVFSGSKQIVALNPRDGSQIWRIEGPTEQFVASMVYDGERFFMTAGFPDYHVMAIKPNGAGNVTDSHVAWHSTDAKAYVPSPVVTQGMLFIADDRGTGNCFDAQSGERYWQERMGKHYSGSLVVVNGLVYFTADDGITKIVKPGQKLEVIAENRLGETTYASPAIAAGRLYLRGSSHLFCIAER